MFLLENYSYRGIAKKLFNIYCTDPHRSQQRWTYENTNQLIREFFPRWTDLLEVIQKESDKVVEID